MPTFPSINPLFEESVKTRRALNDFIEKVYFPAAYAFLAKINPIIKGPRGVKGLFLEVFSTPVSEMNYQTKEVIVYTIEGGSLYSILEDK